MFDFRQNADAHRILDRDSATLLPVYARYPVVMDHGNGVYLFDSSGNRYLDLMGGLGVNALGHAHPRMVAAMADQAGKLVHSPRSTPAAIPASWPSGSALSPDSRASSTPRVARKPSREL